MIPNQLTLPASSLRRVLIALVTLAVLATALTPVVMAKPGGGNPGGNSGGSAACENGGYLNWTTNTGATFKNEGACVKYAAMGGQLVAVVPPTPDLRLSPGTLETGGAPFLKTYTYDFGPVWSATTTFTVTNGGTGTSHLLLLVGGDARFALSNITCGFPGLAPGGTCTFDVTFTAPACNAGDQYPENFDLRGIDPATGTPSDFYIRLNVVGSCPSPFSISYSGSGSFSYNLTATGLVPGSPFQIFFHYSGQSLHEVGSADGSGVVNFFDTATCTFAGPSDPVLGVAAVGSPVNGAPGSVFGLPLPDATICPPPV